MPHQLFVEQLSEDGRIGRTANIAMMEKNIEVLHELYPDGPPASPVVFPAGRWVTILAEDGEDTFMLFVDLDRNAGAAFDWAQRFEDTETRDAFLEAVRDITDRYDILQDQVELVVSTAFPSNPAIL